VLIAAFVLSNALVLQLEPGLFRPQLYGLLAGGFIIALSIFPQVFDWRIDYTATSGEADLFIPQMLKSTIWKDHMPIGLYSNRGYTAFVLAALGILTLLGAFWGWVRTIPAIVLSVLFCTALFCTQSRAGLLALLVATVYLLLRFYFKSARRWLVLHYKITLLLSCWLFLFTYLVLKTTVTLPTVEVRHLLSPDNLEKFSTGRLHLWNLSLRGIVERPLLGWGFSGFSIAFPFIADWTGRHQGYLIENVPIAQVLRLDTFTFDYLGTDGKLHTGFLLATKAHNLFLDTALSVGILGLLLYLLLFGFSLWCVAKTTFRGVEAVGIVYLVYTLTWSESAQFSHIAWWALSAGFASVLKNKGHSNCEASNFARHDENG
jgi:O-antigen ligase